jgi:hypothetical protein
MSANGLKLQCGLPCRLGDRTVFPVNLEVGQIIAFVFFIGSMQAQFSGRLVVILTHMQLTRAIWLDV